MIARSRVYAAIDIKRRAQATSYPDNEFDVPLTVGDELTLIHDYCRMQPTINSVVVIAALAVRCMQTHGQGSFLPGRMDRDAVYRIIDGERDYQDKLGPDRTTRSIGDYATMLRHYLRIADTQWTMNPGDSEALDVIRKIAGICVHCLEDLLIE